MDTTYQKRYIKVGEIFVGVRPTEIVTVLGSCVAVCLYDPVERVSALNHYLMPLWNGSELQSPKYGDISIPRLIESMENVGCHVRNIQAKLFGGANLNISTNEQMMIGKRNVVIAKEILQEYRIPIVAQDVEGSRGRRIMVISDTGKVKLKYTRNATEGV
ncbi:chemotaxis protein CheD [Desulfurispira natronophila]|uniref:Probable chemoreceptor glutamine deamidase CheD n=1 Tax=Desulfurispira natronophila TaxID=682562 RepID=A0A7W7Y2E1_9BACT|nr:chemotaxis protein CheD [Desulfurispira natronophila]MBB5020826.1 chemotaxis protein CheD [Desulfurispira natronophila]